MKPPHYEKSIGESPSFRKFTFDPKSGRWEVGKWEDIDPKKLVTKDGIRFYKIEDIVPTKEAK